MNKKKYKFFESLLYSNYKRELYYLCHQIDIKASTLFSVYDNLNTEHGFITDINCLDQISSILSYAARVQELTIYTNKNKIHAERAFLIRSMFDFLNINEIFNKKVRNTIEHFAQYLDNTNKKHTLYNTKKRYLVAFNMVISKWEKLIESDLPFTLYSISAMPDTPLYPIRIYVSGERKFYNMDWSIDLNALYIEACLIKKFLIEKGFLEEETPEKWLSGFIVCAPE